MYITVAVSVRAVSEVGEPSGTALELWVVDLDTSVDDVRAGALTTAGVVGV